MGLIIRTFLLFFVVTPLLATAAGAITVNVTVTETGKPLPGATVSFETPKGVPITVTAKEPKTVNRPKPKVRIRTDRVRTSRRGRARANIPRRHKRRVVVVVSKNDQVLVKQLIRNIFGGMTIRIDVGRGAASSASDVGTNDGTGGAD